MKKIFYMIFFYLYFNFCYALETRIIYNIQNEIITNVDIKNEYKYLLALNAKLKDLEKEKIITKDPTLHFGEVKKVEDFIDFKLATVFRLDEEDRIPHNSTLNKKTSNLFGQVKYYPSNKVDLEYTFSLKNDLESIEYGSIMGLFEFNKFSTQLTFTDARGPMGSTNVAELTTEFNFNDENSLKFGTRRNRDINLTEFYDLVYEYKNDCLVANIDYRKKYYSSKTMVPLEELFFSITIIPITTFSPEKMVLNKHRED